MADLLPSDFDEHMTRAVAAFWKGRTKQGKKQKKGAKVQGGTRGNVLGGGHLNAFVALVRYCLKEAGVPETSILAGKKGLVVPGFYRPTKKWDLLVVHKGHLLAAIEFKSQVGSFGNNLNNRTEEALGNSTDLLAAYEKGLLKPSPRPWLGWIMLMEDAPKSTRAVKVAEPHFKVDPIFVKSSYSNRYTILARRMLHQRLYDGAAVLMSPRKEGKKGVYSETDPELTIRRFMASLVGKVIAGVQEG